MQPTAKLSKQVIKYILQHSIGYRERTVTGNSKHCHSQKLPCGHTGSSTDPPPPPNPPTVPSDSLFSGTQPSMVKVQTHC